MLAITGAPASSRGFSCSSEYLCFAGGRGPLALDGDEQRIVLTSQPRRPRVLLAFGTAQENWCRVRPRTSVTNVRTGLGPSGATASWRLILSLRHLPSKIFVLCWRTSASARFSSNLIGRGVLTTEACSRSGMASGHRIHPAKYHHFRPRGRHHHRGGLFRLSASVAIAAADHR